MKPTLTATTWSGWSRCGEWPQSASSSSCADGRRCADTRDLLHRAVLVVHALDGQHRAADARQLGLDVPGAEGRIAARCRSSPRRPNRRRHGGAPGAARRSVPADRLRACAAMLSHRYVLDEHCGAITTSAGHRLRESRRMQQRDRAAVAVAHQPGGCSMPSACSSAGSTSCAWWCMKSTPQRSLGGARRGAAVAGARIHQAAAARGAHSRCGKSRHIATRTQAFVQEDQQRRGPRVRREPFVLDAHAIAAPVDARRTPPLMLTLGASCSRSLKRWILPVAVFGSSATNSIHRGYL